MSHTKEDFNKFSKSLVLGPKDLKYQFFNFRKIYIGHQERENSWERELSIIQKFRNPIWLKRTSILQSKSRGITNEVGICSSTRQKKLKFNRDFAFWKAKYNPDKINPVAVYLTVSSILQNLREKPYTMFDKESLYSHVYQHSVLDPNNFSRFNDPLLQSCLWRCAYDSELDYRASDDLSRQFIDIIIKLAKRRAKREHNAILDLLVGVAVMRIQLSKDTLREMLEALNNILTDIPEFVEILEFIRNDFKHPNLDEGEF